MKLILGILLAAAVAVALFQQSQISRLKRTVADLNAQVQQAATDGAADQVLEVQLKELRDREANNRRELARLRGQVSKISQLEKDNAALTADKNRLAGQIAQLSQQTTAQSLFSWTGKRGICRLQSPIL